VSNISFCSGLSLTLEKRDTQSTHPSKLVLNSGPEGPYEKLRSGHFDMPIADGFFPKSNSCEEFRTPLTLEDRIFKFFDQLRVHPVDIVSFLRETRVHKVVQAEQVRPFVATMPSQKAELLLEPQSALFKTDPARSLKDNITNNKDQQEMAP